jgi:type VI secretion system protein ImpF
MAELLPQDRLQPSLLDRLVDNEPEQRVESVEKRVMNMSRLRESVLRDLNWLFNCAQAASAEEIEASPLMARSVVNFGLPPFAGMTASGVELRTMENALRQAIIDFEPRLLPESVRVKARRIESGGDNHHNALSFDIECRLWAQPAPIALLLYSEIDLESGQNSVKESGRR